MLCHRANYVSPTIVGNCLSCEDGQDVHAYLVDVYFGFLVFEIVT